MQRGPGEETGFIQQQADDDQRDKRAGGVPDDVPYHGDVRKADRAAGEGQDRAQGGAPADAKPLGLPDNQDDGGDKNSNGDKHELTLRWLSGRCWPVVVCNHGGLYEGG